jgi:hypothetical protein
MVGESTAFLWGVGMVLAVVFLIDLVVQLVTP